MIEIINAFGHHNVRATHRTTFEVTKEEHLTPRGDCIVGVKADKSLIDLPDEFKEIMQSKDTKLEIILRAGDLEEKINAHGHRDLTFTHPTDMVVRKSDFVCGRTLAVGADKAAIDLSREIVEKLKDDKCGIVVELRIIH